MGAGPRVAAGRVGVPDTGLPGTLLAAVLAVGVAVGALVVALVSARRRAAAAEVREAGLQQAQVEQLARIRELETRLEGAKAQHEDNLARLESFVAGVDRNLAERFKAAAAQIIEEKSATLTEASRTRLDEILGPFRERLVEFHKKVEDAYGQEARERFSMKGELERLMQLNQQVSDDARRLTTALKGESKAQGTWGEIILERVLGMSGLERGREYDVQDAQRDEFGARLQPDVVVRLPEARHLVIDAKVSLTAWERFVSAEDDESRTTALQQHLASLRNHIRGLGEKNYAGLYGPGSPDFVLLFVAVEPAFLSAVQADPDLYANAWRRNIVLVSPTTLMATLRIVDSVWRLERQNVNAAKIAEQGGRLYDAFVLYMTGIEKAVKAVTGAQEAVVQLRTRAISGRGNLLKRMEDLRRLGVRTSRTLPTPVLADSDDAAACDGDDEHDDPPGPPADDTT